ncbi:CocE/NonD family hydrolase [Streptantibioticus ferralitis]|uniref:CocE/NonD family hydrolase n=1 Tax=Streptantibioticus ferralitis TaxID=236510 RepID=A0ABT5ZBE9_9ACTN|nr:CocE/NonD family hydrolase [Streptantibioticus ferralitis]MDF2261043.1 CocE/NonD family hydrolase [Streptantibioticus ferralitis]
MTTPHASPRRTIACAVCVALAATAALAVAPAATAAPVTTAAVTGAAPTTSFRFVDIPGSGGVTLKGNVLTPSGDDGTRKYPVVILPSSWALNDLEYTAQAKSLADSGYVVVSYTPRGFWLSGGRIEVAGPPDVADISKVVDWTLAHTPADPAHIGMAGISYGAGLGLMGAAHDKRIRAVVALSGWADLIDSIYSGRTQHLQATALLGASGYLTGRPSASLQQTLADFLASRYDKEADMIAWGRERSPATYVDQINANGAAIMLGNAWGDSLFNPNQLAAFYERLRTAKRLEFRPGDHATPEATGLFGLPNDTWNDARRWLDHYLKGADNGIDREPPVRLASRTGGGYESYASWRSVPSTTRKLLLGARDFLGTGSLGDAGATAWSTRIGTNIDSGADGGIIFLSQLADQFVKLPPIASIPLLPRSVAAVWQSQACTTAQRVRGTVRLHTTLTSTGDRASIVAYLYDVDALGIGKLITHAPQTSIDRTPGRPTSVDLGLFSTAYDVPAGHRLALVIDTVDPLYITHNPVGSTLSFSASAADPSWLSVPLRQN